MVTSKTTKWLMVIVIGLYISIFAIIFFWKPAIRHKAVIVFIAASGLFVFIANFYFRLKSARDFDKNK